MGLIGYYTGRTALVSCKGLGAIIKSGAIIWNKVKGIICTGWLPAWKITSNLQDIWRDNIVQIVPSGWEMFRSAWQLIFTLALLVITFGIILSISIASLKPC